MGEEGRIRRGRGGDKRDGRWGGKETGEGEGGGGVGEGGREILGERGEGKRRREGWEGKIGWKEVGEGSYGERYWGGRGRE